MIVLITGTSRGLGAFLVQWLSRHGHTVVGSSRTPAGGSADLPLDVTRPRSCEEAVATVLSRHGRLDALINNAGSHLLGAALETTADELRGQLELNLLGAVNMVQAVAPAMLAQRAGRIVNISSVGGVVATPFASAYNASKFALEGYSRSLRAELAPFGVHVSTLTPGFLRTSTHRDSVYAVRGNHPLFTAHRQRVHAHMEAAGLKGLALDRVGRAVSSILAARRPRARTSVDGLAPMLQLLEALLPAALFERILVAQTAPGFPGGAQPGPAVAPR